MTIPVRRPVYLGILGFAVFLAALGVWMHFYGRPPLEEHRAVIAFDGVPNATGRERTLLLLRARLAEMSDPRWSAQIVAQPDGSLLLSYRKRGGATDLPQSIIPRGLCEFRFFEPDRDKLAKALRDGPPEGAEIMQYLETCDGYNERTGQPVRRLYPKLVEKRPVLQPRSFKNVSFWTKGFAKYSHVRFEFAGEDVARLARLSESSRGRPLALIVDGVIRMTMLVGDRADGGVIEICDLLDNAEAEKLIKVLRLGPLPCSLRIVSATSRHLQ